MFFNISINLTLSITFISFLLFIVLYFIIYRKYNKRNELNITEIIINCVNFSVKSAIHVFILILGLDYFIEGLLLIEAKYERYANFVVSVFIISGTIYHYIRYIKKSLIDIDKSQIQVKANRNEKIAEYILFIFLGLMIITPILYIPRITAVMIDTKTMFFEILKSIGCTVIGIFLMFYMNPLEIIYKKKENLEETLINKESNDKNIDNDKVEIKIEDNKIKVKSKKKKKTNKKVSKKKGKNRNKKSKNKSKSKSKSKK